MHKFLWPDESGKIENYAILRVNIVDRPAACLAMLATRLTAQLPEFTEMKGAVDTIEKSMYVDDILDSADDILNVERLKCEITNILNRGGFKNNMWIHSGTKPTEK